VELFLIFTGRALRRTFPRLALMAICALPAAAQLSSPIPADVCVDSTPGALWKAAPMSSVPASAAEANQASAETARVIQQLIPLRYPELNLAQVKVRTFHSDYDYFRTRFSLGRFFTLRPMRYFVEVNPRLVELNPPPEGVCAILGHELAHILTMSHGNRLRLFGLLRLASPAYTTRFERRADLEAIHRGFAPGLKSYRQWVYRNIPPEKVARKKRDYFTPEEIDAMVGGSR
jgi:hypothetical protein